MNPHITPGIDVALLVFWAFVLFFIGLVFYLRREDRREGYPLEDEMSGRLDTVGGPMHTASTKSFLLPFGHGRVYAPDRRREPVDIAARRTDRFAGAPYAPTGNPLVDGIGPAAWAERARRPDVDMDGHPRIVPLSAAADFAVAYQDPTLRDWPVIGADGATAGTVRDLWIDRSDRLIRYIEVETAGGVVLAPMMMAKVDRRRRRVVIDALRASQFADAPRIEASDRITLYEEERVQAYFGGGYLYATPARQEPWL
ncbi:photosynthetic reaction center subunit H [Sphingomonas ginsenosidivorax]|uniref:Photosynthetic reaction center subunit H n=1 Tax=Sphingomonas ginsenosidivorax TaxID=862135 RepID=A0A5C6UEP0_9SPHN|nr:photosynthetic reaction center subunit H [Sphingomonas ginsenosidivorax]TXC71169.1 photosynthetic reaction center subunit H [Sphingomonas ginsenosidivorax]